MSKSSLLRIVDASLNRAAEGLRVVEDYLRFALDDSLLTEQAKTLRHELTDAARAIASLDRHAARDTVRDVGTAISIDSERQRDDAHAVCIANLKRTEQSLRSLEEYGKLLDTRLARRIEALRYRLYTLEKAIDIARFSRDRLDSVRLCVLVDGSPSLGQFQQLIATLVEAGVGMIQLRDKRLEDRELIARARLLVSLTRRQPPAEPEADRRTRFRPLAIVNDRPDVAAIVAADGVHLGQQDFSVKDARTIVGTQMLIGVSTHNLDQARTAVLDGANYLGAGPTFPSRTKSFDEFAGLNYLRQVAAEIKLPTFAIGGINSDNLADVLATGITRVAVGAAVAAAPDPGSAARELSDMLNSAVSGPEPV